LKKELIMCRPKIAVFAGPNDGGVPGLKELFLESRDGILDADITDIVSYQCNGAARRCADENDIPFHQFYGPGTAETYQQIAKRTSAKRFLLYGWLKRVEGLYLGTIFNSRTVFGVFPGPVAEFCKPGIFGKHVHAEVVRAYQRGEITHTAFSIYFVASEYGHGPVLFEQKIAIGGSDTPQTLSQRVRHYETVWLSKITSMVVNGLIGWDGVNPKSLWYPEGYEITRFENEV
jgi:folate-dependent phosphoribosylglycinamide formyltransferase PurN